ncbi:MAG TPA: ABC transporter ATP-binding protein [Actinomycetota bacterium]|nr:ABC transporter ATP-binding protein [Actinomycetota bacterium]
MPDAVVARALEKRYSAGGERAVAAIDFTVRTREFFGFLGPNGAGKTTTMRMISCRSQRSGGDLEVLGLDPARAARAVKRSIGVVPQETNLDSVLNVRENLVAHARYFDVPRAEARARADELLEFVSLADRAEWHVDALSGGMKRRLLIARGLINRPTLLVLDEPTTGLDPQARHLVWDRLRELRRRGVTLVITTHYMDEAAQLCDRIVIMHQGRILVTGSPAELIRTHVEPAVVELTAASAGELERLAAAVGPYAARHEVAGDRVVLHADDAEALLKTARDAGVEYDSATFRAATLEDVFLKLTGRRLEE